MPIDVDVSAAWPSLESAASISTPRVLDVATSWGIEITGDIVRVTDIDAVVSWDFGTLTELNNDSVRTITSAAVSWGIQVSADIERSAVRVINANVRWGIAAPTDLVRFTTTSVVANVSWPALSSEPSLLTVYFTQPGRELPVRVETQNPALLGAQHFCHGPYNTVVVGSERARKLSVVRVRDPHTLQVAGSVSLPGAPLEVASRVFGRPLDEQYIFVVVDRTDEAGSRPKVQVWNLQNMNAPRLLGEITPPGRVFTLWAPDDAGTSDLWRRAETEFIVFGGESGIELRSADPELRLLARADVGLYRPFVAEVISRNDLGFERPGVLLKEVWDVVMFSERTAFGMTLRVTRRRSSITTQSDGTLEADRYTIEPLMPYPAEQVEGPFGTRWLVDHVHGVVETLVSAELNDGGQYIIADDEPPGFNREWRGTPDNTIRISQAGAIPAGNPRVLAQSFLDTRVVDIPIQEFTGHFNIAFRDNRDTAMRYAKVEFAFVRADGSVIDNVEVWGRFQVQGNYRQQGPPYNNDAWVTDARYAEVLYFGHAFNRNFADGLNVHAVVRPPDGTQVVRFINWSYAYPRNASDFAAGNIERSFPYEFPVQTRPRIWVDMRERQISVPVRRYDQVQTWGPTTNTPVRRTRGKFRKERILGADWVFELSSVIPSLDRQPLDAVTADGPRLPRNAVARVRGGVLHAHGDLGRLSKHHIIPDEFFEWDFQV